MPLSYPIFLHFKAGMTVIVEDVSDWRMADVGSSVINWVDADPVTQFVPRCCKQGSGLGA